MKEKYIYLDWNIFKYLKESDIDKRFEKAIDWLSYRYKFPFSFAHLCDRQKGMDNQIKDDLEFVAKISEGFMFGLDEEKNDYEICKQNIFDKYEEVKNSKNIIYPNYSVENEMKKEIIQMGFEEYFRKYEDPLKLYIVLMASLNRFNSDYELYKLFREFMIQQGERNKKNSGFIGIIVNETFTQQDVKELINEYKKYQGGEGLSICQQMMVTYCLLEFKRKLHDKSGDIRIYDKINSKNNFSNIYTDSQHMVNAKFADYFVTNDERMIKKVKLIYENFDIKTQIVNAKTFLDEIVSTL